MRNENNTRPRSSGWCCSFFSTQEVETTFNHIELRSSPPIEIAPIELADWSFRLEDVMGPFLPIDNTYLNFNRDHVRLMIDALEERQPRNELMEHILEHSRFSNRDLDRELVIIRQTWANDWRANFRQSTADSELAVAIESLNSTKLANYPDLEIDDEFICAISREIMTNPVYDPNYPQQKYDLLVIREWLKEHPTNPMTRTELSLDSLVYDEGLKQRIDDFVDSVTSQNACRR